MSDFSIKHPSIFPLGPVAYARSKRKKHFSVFKSFRAAIDGILLTVQSQRNMRVHLGAALSVSLIATTLELDLSTRSTLIFSMALILFAEILNTSIEAIVDLYIEKFHHFAMIAKDAAAGGVLFLACATAFVFCSILWENQVTLLRPQKPLVYAAISGTVLIGAVISSINNKLLAALSFLTALCCAAFTCIYFNDFNFSGFILLILIVNIFSVFKKPSRLSSQT